MYLYGVVVLNVLNVWNNSTYLKGEWMVTRLVTHLYAWVAVN